MKKAEKLLQRHEGWRSIPYKDSLDNWTVGYGFALKYVSLPKWVGNLWLKALIWKYKSELYDNYSWFSDLDTNRQAAIIDMYYNLGRGGFASFKNMINALENKQYEKAATQMLDSRWAEQVGSRSTELAAIIKGDNHSGI